MSCELEHGDDDLRVNKLSNQRRKYQLTISCELEHVDDDYECELEHDDDGNECTNCQINEENINLQYPVNWSLLMMTMSEQIIKSKKKISTYCIL